MRALVAAGLLLGTLPACGHPSSTARVPERRARTPAEQTRRDSFSQEWLRRQDSAFRADSAVASVIRIPPLVMTSPLVIGFMPPPHWNGVLRQLEHDSTSARFQEDSATRRTLADQAGFSFVVRYGPRIAIHDPWYNAARSIEVGTDSVGVVVVAPGLPAQTRFGRVDAAGLRQMLGSYAERLGRQPAPAPGI